MAIRRPFHRNVRGVRDGPNAGYSRWGFVLDPLYARDPEHYVRAFLLIQKDLQELFEYVEPSSESASTYSYRIHALLMRTCIEIEANFKAILNENKFTPPSNRKLTINDYRRLDPTHHLSSYEVMLPIWRDEQVPVWKPFGPWRQGRGLPNASGLHLSWYQAYNASKHDRHAAFKHANLHNLVMSVAGLLVLLSSQFADQDFSAGDMLLSCSGYDPHPMEPAIGSLFRIQYPTDWTEDELYDFDWSQLKTQEHRFEKLDYDAVAV